MLGVALFAQETVAKKRKKRSGKAVSYL